MVYVYSIVEHEHYTQVIEYARVGWYFRQREIGAKVGHIQMFLFFSPKSVLLNFQKSCLIPTVDMQICIHIYMHKYISSYANL